MELTSSAAHIKEVVLFAKPMVDYDRSASADDVAEAIDPCAIDRSSQCGLIDHYEQAPEAQLMVNARHGDQQAFVELSRRSADSIRRRLLSILRNREDAEDALQEALLKAYTHFGQFRNRCKFSTWLTTIAINTALMQLRKKGYHSDVSILQRREEDKENESWDFPDPSPNAEQLYARRQMTDLLNHVVERLPKGSRNVVRHYHERECSMQEVADHLGITVAAVKSRLLRARTTMRSNFGAKRVTRGDGG